MKRKSKAMLLVALLLTGLFVCAACTENETEPPQATDTPGTPSAPLAPDAEAAGGAEPSPGIGATVDKSPQGDGAGQIMELSLADDIEDGDYVGIIRGVYNVEGRDAIEFDAVDDGEDGEKVNLSTIIIHLPITPDTVFEPEEDEGAASDLDAFKAALGDDDVYYVITVEGGDVTRVSFGGAVLEAAEGESAPPQGPVASDEDA